MKFALVSPTFGSTSLAARRAEVAVDPPGQAPGHADSGMLGAIAGAFSKPVLRLVIRNARRLSHDDAERERAAAAAKR